MKIRGLSTSDRSDAAVCKVGGAGARIAIGTASRGEGQAACDLLDRIISPIELRDMQPFAELFPAGPVLYTRSCANVADMKMASACSVRKSGSATPAGSAVLVYPLHAQSVCSVDCFFRRLVFRSLHGQHSRPSWPFVSRSNDRWFKFSATARNSSARQLIGAATKYSIHSSGSVTVKMLVAVRLSFSGRYGGGKGGEHRTRPLKEQSAFSTLNRELRMKFLV